MVQATDPGGLLPESESPLCGISVKTEVDDPLEEEHGPDNKRLKQGSALQQWTTDQAPYNVLNDQSPLGLRLRKSPSLLDLIQMRLSQGTPPKAGESRSETGKKETKPSSSLPDKMKASNFPATTLKIGSWECVSRYEGDLVAKCYFAKRKLVWEVLNGGLKSKIEIQWSDITALKATFSENGPDTLDLVVSRPPLFFRETNPQPRKHTLWQATSDFTGGQASRNRRHFLQVPHGLLGKHFDKLIGCDPHLSELSRQPDINLSSPLFDSKSSIFEEMPSNLEQIKSEYGSPAFSVHQEATSPSAGSQHFGSNERASASSGTIEVESRAAEENSSCVTGEQNPTCPFRVPGIRPSMSMSDFVSQIGQCINEKTGSDDQFLEINRDALEEMTQQLLSDSQCGPASDEPSLMSRVNSLYCLLQKDPAAAQNLLIGRGCGEEEGEEETDSAAMDGRDPPPAISRKESSGDLLLYLPRIASLPQFLFDIAEDPVNKEGGH
ncbi:uncharacterized protein LOC144713049 [Wolffia australiana]